MNSKIHGLFVLFIHTVIIGISASMIGGASSGLVAYFIARPDINTLDAFISTEKIFTGLNAGVIAFMVTLCAGTPAVLILELTKFNKLHHYIISFVIICSGIVFLSTWASFFPIYGLYSLENFSDPLSRCIFISFLFSIFIFSILSWKMMRYIR